MQTQLLHQETLPARIRMASRPYLLQSHGTRKPARNPSFAGGTHRARDRVRRAGLASLTRAKPWGPRVPHRPRAICRRRSERRPSGRPHATDPGRAHGEGEQQVATAPPSRRGSVLIGELVRPKRCCSRPISTGSVVESWPPELEGRTAGYGKPNGSVGNRRLTISPGSSPRPARGTFKAPPTIAIHAAAAVHPRWV